MLPALQHGGYSRHFRAHIPVYKRQILMHLVLQNTIARLQLDKMQPTTELLIPDLLSLCPFPWSSNPHHSRANKESTEWVLSHGIFANSKRARIISSNGALLGAHTYTYANADVLRTCSDFLNLLFTLDEISDDQDINGVRRTRDAFVNALNGKYDDNSVVSRFTKDFMKRLSKSTKEFRRRFITHCTDYIDTVLPEADLRAQGKVLSLEEYVHHRRENGGVRPCFDLFEYAFGITLPDAVFKDPAFMRAYFAAVDMIGWSNDVYSYAAELSRGLEGNNALTILMKTKGLSITEALDYVEVEFKQFLKTFVTSKAQIRSFGPEVDAAVRSYIHGMEQWVVGNIVWSFDTQRYFGADHEEVKRTRIVKLKQLESAK
ncbi:hypothetical protein EW145_g1031 [Phellinidium pouzarii]|uniref:Terpene synthase n=1 Tax=Phellinidium pouzarii TaxID=167371 RepID=A0A4S4LHV6_9AGAM|nr:hypothetical protein EW145_g1031 [Phellinidium pouzarii]